MSKPNSWLTFVVHVCVVLSIIFVALEIRQNTLAIKAQSRISMAESEIDGLVRIATDPEVAGLLLRASATADTEALTREELLSFNFLIQSSLRMWENEQYQYQMGFFEDSEFLPRVQRWKSFIRLPGIQRVWQSVKQGYSPEFRELMEDIDDQAPHRPAVEPGLLPNPTANDDAVKAGT